MQTGSDECAVELRSGRALSPANDTTRAASACPFNIKGNRSHELIDNALRSCAT